MPTIDYAMGKLSYRDWNTWHMARELVQNALDERDTYGAEMAVRLTKGQRLIVETKGGRGPISAEAFMIGGTDKRGTGQRGSHGDGLKGAAIVATRLGANLVIRSGYETRKFSFRASKNFGGADSLHMMVTTNATYLDGVKMSVDLSVDSYAELLRRVPEIRSGERMPYGKIDARPPALYARGIYVQELEDATHSYNLNIELDRDRQTVGSFTLQAHVAGVWKTAATDDEIIEALWDPKTLEARAIAASCRLRAESCVDALDRKLDCEFAIPVANSETYRDGRHYGLNTVIVPTTVVEFFELTDRSYSDAIAKAQTEAKRVWAREDLTATELDNLDLAISLVKLADAPIGEIEIVDFIGKFNGMYRVSDGRTQIARFRLSDLQDVVSTLVHEVAHHAGKDYSPGHTTEMQRMFSMIIVKM